MIRVHVVIWDRNDYITKAESQLKNKLVYKKVSFKQEMVCDLVTKSNDLFKDLSRSECITDKELKYFSYEYNKLTNESCIYFRKSIKGWKMYLEEQRFQTAVHALKRYQSFWIITLNWSCKVVDIHQK